LSETAEAPTPTTPQFKIESLEDMRKILVIAKGGDPNAIQAITNFMDFKSNAERSYLPDKTLTLCVGQLSGFGKVYYPDDDWNPFSLVSDVLSITFMGYKGFKSNQFVDMTRQTPNLDALQTSSEDAKQGIIARVLGRGKPE
jgi:hypothetical protein